MAEPQVQPQQGNKPSTRPVRPDIEGPDAGMTREASSETNRRPNREEPKKEEPPGSKKQETQYVDQDLDEGTSGAQ